MIKITFEGTPNEVFAEMNAFLQTRVKADTNPEIHTGLSVPAQTVNNATAEPKNWTTQDTATNVVAPVKTVPVVPTAPVKEYKLEELQTAMQPFINDRLSELQALLTKYQVVSLIDLPKERYPEIAADLRAMGARL